MLKYTPSNLAAAAIYLAQRIITQGTDGWTKLLESETGYSEQMLRACAKDMIILLGGIERCTLQAVRKKFSLSRFNEVALVRLDQQANV
jgi:hypothetical protein